MSVGSFIRCDANAWMCPEMSAQNSNTILSHTQKATRDESLALTTFCFPSTFRVWDNIVPKSHESYMDLFMPNTSNRCKCVWYVCVGVRSHTIDWQLRWICSNNNITNMYIYNFDTGWHSHENWANAMKGQWLCEWASGRESMQRQKHFCMCSKPNNVRYLDSHFVRDMRDYYWRRLQYSVLVRELRFAFHFCLH